MSGNKLSFSKMNMYADCGRKYDLHYNKKLRSKTMSGALVFGGALDKALNHLITTKDLKAAEQIFLDNFTTTEINREKVYVPNSELIVYAESDLDEDLLDEKNEDFSRIKAEKEKVGYDNLDPTSKKAYNRANWLSMKRKGQIMLQSYYDQILPRIIKVHAIQERISLENDQGDELEGFLDMVVTLDDGKTYLLDNKTSTRTYDKNEAKKSPQLVAYYHEAREKYGINGVGFIVISKNINKNKKKTCKICGHDGSGGRFKTCNFEINDVRCDGEWEIEIDPKAHIELILNTVPETEENLVIESFDAINEAIKAGVFFPNLGNCMKYNKKCAYYDLCHENKMTGLVDLSKEKK